jgi:hypothetical protein
MSTLYSPKIVTDGLVLHLDAANKKSYSGSGTTWTDRSGSENNGTLTNGPTFDSANGGGLTFDETNDYINFGNATDTNFGSDNFTIECVAYIDPNVSNNTYKGIVVKKGAGSANAGYGIYYNTSQEKFLWSTADGSSYSERFSTNTWSSIENSYANIVMVRDSAATNNGHFYINGVYESLASTASMLDVDNTYNLVVGASSTLYSQYYLKGKVSQVKLYNRALTASEVLQNYNATKSRFGL